MSRRSEWAARIIAALFLVLLVLLFLRASGAESRQPIKWHAAVASVFNTGTEPALACRVPRYKSGPKKGRVKWLVVAHKTLPCGTRVRFMYRGRKADARVGDRGPYIGGREWDLDIPLMEELHFPYGVARVHARVLR